MRTRRAGAVSERKVFVGLGFPGGQGGE